MLDVDVSVQLAVLAEGSVAERALVRQRPLVQLLVAAQMVNVREGRPAVGKRTGVGALVRVGAHMATEVVAALEGGVASGMGALERTLSGVDHDVVAELGGPVEAAATNLANVARGHGYPTRLQ
jgi:hypothetical protein